MTEVEDADHEPDNDGGTRIKRQGKLLSMTERDFRHMTMKDGDVYMVHGGRIMNPEAVGRLRNNAIQVSAGIDPEPALKWLKRLLHERKQGMKTWQ